MVHSLSSPLPRPSKRFGAPCFVLVVGVALSGCSYLRALVGLGPTRPKVRVTDVAVSNFNFLRLDLEVGLRVDNPNDFDLTFSKLRYRMTASDLVIAQGSYDPKVVVPKSGHVDVKLPLSVDAEAALTLIQDVVGGKRDVEALMSAVADFATPLGDMEVDFEDRRPLKKLR